MSMAISNRLLPLLTGIIIVVGVMVTIKSCSDAPQDRTVMTAVPRAPAPDVDTPADTIKTLTANVSAMTEQLMNLRRDNTELQQKNQQLLTNQQQIEETITTRLEKKWLAKTQAESAQAAQHRDRDTSTLRALSARIDALSQRLSSQPSQPLSSSDHASDLPVGIGLDDLVSPPAISEGVRWQAPLEQDPDARQVSINQTDRLLKHYGAATAPSPALTGTARANKITALNVDAVTPVYTLPRNATLMGSTAMTALVGRIPVQGQVRDPMPFKVITGKDNLAANGLAVPGVQGMIWSGTAIGDWTLSCVSGQLESVTFVFDDGTIQTLSSDDRSLPASGSKPQKPLGWISDTQGIPCVSGERKTNASAFLSQRLGVKAIEAAAEAAAQSETTTVLGDNGRGSRQVTGDIEQFVLGKTLSGGSQAIAQWLEQRQAQSFDAVFVPAGVELAIHLDHELPIDFHFNGRKLYYERAQQNRPPYARSQRASTALD